MHLTTLGHAFISPRLVFIAKLWSFDLKSDDIQFRDVKSVEVASHLIQSFMFFWNLRKPKTIKCEIGFSQTTDLKEKDTQL